MSAGTPVIALGKAGVLESVIEGKTGLFFDEQSVVSIKQALEKFDAKKFKQEDLLNQAAKFSNDNFALSIQEYLQSIIDND
jgi:glycosyltransferase involved in cell wall biosynthesis